MPKATRYAGGSNLAAGESELLPDFIRRFGEQGTVASISGTGPFTVNLNTATEGTLAAIHNINDPIEATGPGWATGSGKQTVTTGNGTADRYRGSDGTHPTSDFAASGGHPALARTVYAALLRAAAL
jgi:hypothetical protein